MRRFPAPGAEVMGVVGAAWASCGSLPIAADCSSAVNEYEILVNPPGDGIEGLVPGLLGIAVVNAMLVASQADGASQEDGAGCAAWKRWFAIWVWCRCHFLCVLGPYCATVACAHTCRVVRRCSRFATSCVLVQQQKRIDACL